MQKIIKKDNLKIKNFKEYILSFSIILTIVPLNIFYVILNNFNKEANSLVTKFDMAIPFIKIFIIPYIAWYAFIFFTMAYICYKDKETFVKTVISYNLGLIAAYITFLFFQTTVPRPEITGTDILTKLVMMIYKNDNPYNCFPSIHVLTSFLMIKSIYASNCKNKINVSIISIISILIILSTLFVKQHVILDIFGGILYADIIFRFVNAYYYKILNLIKKLLNLKSNEILEIND